MKSKEQEIDIHDEGKGESEAGIGTAPEAYEVTIEGVCELLFHRWDSAEVGVKGNAPKNSKEKKTDNLESYVYRNDDGYLCIPGRVFKAALVHAARSKSDPRSPRKSCKDLANAVLLVEPSMASLGTKAWDYDDAQRVVIQRSAITRIRPAMKSGWQVTFKITSLSPSYIGDKFIHELVDSAGRFSGICDYRPQYGRFRIVKWKKVLV